LRSPIDPDTITETWEFLTLARQTKPLVKGVTYSPGRASETKRLVSLEPFFEKTTRQLL